MHFLKETDFSREAIANIFDQARRFKRNRKATSACLDRQSWGMLFFKNSTRTRVSFEVGLHELGAHPLILSVGSTQINRGESTTDTAKVLSRYLHGLIVRCYEHQTLVDFATAGSIPIVNALSDFLHPCQIYTDMFTLAERWGAEDGDMTRCLEGRKLTFYGDTACNMANSWILGGAHLGMHIALAGPTDYAPGPEILELLEKEGLADRFTFHQDPLEAAENADVIYTDVWVSMGDEGEETTRLKTLSPYAVTAEVMAAAKPNAIFMHCLPAHPGQEVSQEVLDSPASIIFDQAENRLHVQKAILAAIAQ